MRENLDRYAVTNQERYNTARVFEFHHPYADGVGMVSLVTDYHLASNFL
jgi:hypothetical protein